MAGQGQPSTEGQKNQSSAGGREFQGRHKGSIYPTDGDWMGGPVYRKKRNQMEERHSENETMDKKIHEPYDGMG